jgi:16S rRNA (guanine527-N7)-methyltransferase
LIALNHASLKRRLFAGIEQLAGCQVPTPSDAEADRLLALIDLLVKWNSVYNLTAVREPEQMLARHILDSLVLSHWLHDVGTGSADSDARFDVIDVGSGAGIPVLPLAIVRPQLQFASVEPNGKKTRFQQQAIIELALTNVTIVQKRIEDVALRAFCITSRAFAAPADFLSAIQTLCDKDTRVMVMLGQAQRLPDPMPAPFVLEELVPIDIPDMQSVRHIALCRRS